MSAPLLRSRPSAGSIKLRFVRLKSTSTRPGLPIIYLAGGPGSSGIDAAKGDRWALFETLRRHGDVILLDQRGTGLSERTPNCSKPWNFPAKAASEEATTNASMEQAIRACAVEWRAAGITLEAYNTADNAADVADLIRGLGIEKARLVGISYGTFLAFAILRDHPNLVDRVVLAGTEGPDHTLKLPTQADDTLARMERTPEGKKLGTAIRAVFARLAKEPAIVTGDSGARQVVSLYDAQVVTAFLMASHANSQRLWPLYEAAQSGNFAPMARTVQWARKFIAELPAMPLAMDGSSPVSRGRQARAAKLARSSIFGNAVNYPSADLGRALGIPQLPQRYRNMIRSDVPALFISGELDSRTPPGNAEEVRRGFSSSVHLVVSGGGHDNDLFLGSPRIAERISQFFDSEPLRDETIPASWVKS